MISTDLREGVLFIALTSEHYDIWNGCSTEFAPFYILEEISKLVPEGCRLVNIEGSELPVEDVLDRIPDVITADLVKTSPSFALEMCWAYILADENTRMSMIAFHESNGPEMVRQLKLKQIDGTPTAGDLNEMV